jgi:hypothetical protein
LIDPFGSITPGEPVLAVDFDRFIWDSANHCWKGNAILPSGDFIEVGVVSKSKKPAIALEYARFAFGQIGSRIEEGRRYAARQLLEYYNYYNAHLKTGEQLQEEQFVQRMELERIRFSSKGAARIDFKHTLYLGDCIYEGGLIVVEATVDGQFREAYWVTGPDAEEIRRTGRCT